MVGPAPAPSNRRYQELLDDAGHRYALSMLKINMRCIDDETMFRVDISRLRYRRVRFQNNRCRRIIDMFLLGRNWQFRNFEISISESCFRKIKKIFFIFFYFLIHIRFSRCPKISKFDILEHRNMVSKNIKNWCFLTPEMGGVPIDFSILGGLQILTKNVIFLKKIFHFFSNLQKVCKVDFWSWNRGFSAVLVILDFSSFEKVQKNDQKNAFFDTFFMREILGKCKKRVCFCIFCIKKTWFFHAIACFGSSFLDVFLDQNLDRDIVGFQQFWDLEIPPKMGSRDTPGYRDIPKYVKMVYYYIFGSFKTSKNRGG